MNDRTQDLPENEAELLLPFYVNGTASPAEREMVERWLGENSGAADHLARASEEMELKRADAESLGVPSRHVLDALMDRIGEGRRVGGLVERVWSMLSPRYALAGAAALCLLVFAQAGYIVLAHPQTPAQYQTATGPNAAFSGPTALVVFAAGVDFDAVATRLIELGLVFVDGPKPGGIFVVGAPEGSEGRAALARLGQAEGLTRFFQLRS